MTYEANSIIGLGDEVDVTKEAIQSLQKSALDDIEKEEEKFITDLQVVFDEFGVKDVTAENAVKERYVDLSYVHMPEGMVSRIVEILPTPRVYTRVLYVWKPIVSFVTELDRARAASKNWSISTHR